MLSATHIINRLPLSNLSWKSPFEILYKQSPDYSTLRTIGCLCFAANVGEQDKFEARVTSVFCGDILLVIKVTSFLI